MPKRSGGPRSAAQVAAQKKAALASAAKRKRKAASNGRVRGENQIFKNGRWISPPSEVSGKVVKKSSSYGNLYGNPYD